MFKNLFQIIFSTQFLYQAICAYSAPQSDSNLILRPSAQDSQAAGSIANNRRNQPAAQTAAGNTHNLALQMAHNHTHFGECWGTAGVERL